jgi:hypothetical protein
MSMRIDDRPFVFRVEENKFQPSGTARVIQVIESTIHVRGDGTEANPTRFVTQYFSMSGTLLAESDPCQPR